MRIWIRLFSYFFYQFTRESFWAISTITIVNRRLRDIKYVFMIRTPFLRWINLRPAVSAVQANRIPIVPVRLHSCCLFVLFFFFVFVGEFSSNASDNDFRFQDASLLCLFGSAIFITFRHLPIDLRKQKNKKKVSHQQQHVSCWVGSGRLSCAGHS